MTASPCVYTWRDLERGSARRSPTCSRRSTCRADARIAVQVEKSVEALMLYLAMLRAGRSTCR